MELRVAQKPWRTFPCVVQCKRWWWPFWTPLLDESLRVIEFEYMAEADAWVDAYRSQQYVWDRHRPWRALGMDRRPAPKEITLTLTQVRDLCRDYDRVNPSHPESMNEGWAVYCHMLDSLLPVVEMPEFADVEWFAPKRGREFEMSTDETLRAWTSDTPVGALHATISKMRPPYKVTLHASTWLGNGTWYRVFDAATMQGVMIVMASDDAHLLAERLGIARFWTETWVGNRKVEHRLPDPPKPYGDTTPPAPARAYEVKQDNFNEAEQQQLAELCELFALSKFPDMPTPKERQS